MHSLVLMVAAYLFAGWLFSRSITTHIRANAYSDDEMLRMAVQQGSGSWSMRWPMITLILGWFVFAIYGILTALVLDRAAPTYRVVDTA